MSFTIKADVSGLKSYLAQLGDQVEEAARPAAQAGAEVLYKEVQANVSKIRRKTGNLARSIYQAYSENNSSPGRATYHVSWNAKKAPHGHLVEYGHLQRYEYYKDEKGNIRPKVRAGMEGKPRPKSGSRNRAALDAYYVTLPNPKQVAARPFVRPAMSKFPQAVDAARKVLLQQIAKKK